MIYLSIFICFYLFFFRRQRRNFLYRTHVKIAFCHVGVALFFISRTFTNNSEHLRTMESLCDEKLRRFFCVRTFASSSRVSAQGEGVSIHQQNK